MSDCLTDETLALLIDGCLPAPQLAALHEHVDQCEDCQVLLAAAVKEEPATPVVDLELQPLRSLLAAEDRVGPYRILHVLGEGGMGVVFAAVHTTIGRRVAIKLLHRRLSRDPEFRGRFFNERRSANRRRAAVTIAFQGMRWEKPGREWADLAADRRSWLPGGAPLRLPKQ